MDRPHEAKDVVLRVFVKALAKRVGNRPPKSHRLLLGEKPTTGPNHQSSRGAEDLPLPETPDPEEEDNTRILRELDPYPNLFIPSNVFNGSAEPLLTSPNRTGRPGGSPQFRCGCRPPATRQAD